MRKVAPFSDLEERILAGQTLVPFGTLSFPSALPDLQVTVSRGKSFSGNAFFTPKLGEENPVLEGFSRSDPGERMFSSFQLV